MENTEKISQSWEEEMSDAYWQERLVELKIKAGQFPERMEELHHQYLQGKMTEKEYREALDELYTEINETNAQIEALEHALSGEAQIGVASVDGEPSGEITQLAAASESASDIDVAEFVAHAVELVA